LVGARIAVGDEGDTVEGFHIVVGGGYGADGGIARELWRDVKTEECPAAVEHMLRAYLEHRANAAETFQAFTRRHELDALKRLLVDGGKR
jgi:ferredoxin-nitrite reductase